jgi:hypothetical protein
MLITLAEGSNGEKDGVAAKIDIKPFNPVRVRNPDRVKRPVFLNFATNVQPDLS